MPAKKKIYNESKTTEINVKSDMKRCKQVEEKLNECIDISDEDEYESNDSKERSPSLAYTSEPKETKQSISTKSDT